MRTILKLNRDDFVDKYGDFTLGNLKSGADTYQNSNIKKVQEADFVYCENTIIKNRLDGKTGFFDDGEIEYYISRL